MFNFTSVTESNDILSLLISSSDVLYEGNVYGYFILVSVFIIILVSLGMDKKAFSASSFSTSLVALLMVSMGWVTGLYYYICIILFILSIVLLYND